MSAPKTKAQGLRTKLADLDRQIKPIAGSCIGTPNFDKWIELDRLRAEVCTALTNAEQHERRVELGLVTEDEPAAPQRRGLTLPKIPYFGEKTDEHTVGKVTAEHRAEFEQLFQKAWSEGALGYAESFIVETQAIFEKNGGDREAAFSVAIYCGFVSAIASLASSVRARAALVEQRLQALEAQRFELKFCGVFEDGRTYQRGNLVTDDGSLWHCNAVTNVRPKHGSDRWTLVTKRGRDGKDAR